MQPIVNQWVISPKKPHTKTQICLTSKAGNTFCTRSHKMYISFLRHFYRRLNTRNPVVHFVFCPFLLSYSWKHIIGDFLAIRRLPNKRYPVISAASIFHPTVWCYVHSYSWKHRRWDLFLSFVAFLTNVILSYHPSLRGPSYCMNSSKHILCSVFLG